MSASSGKSTSAKTATVESSPAVMPAASGPVPQLELRPGPGPNAVRCTIVRGTLRYFTQGQAGDDSTVAVFGEVDLPLLADMALVQQLDFNASARYTDVDSFGDDETTYKVGLNWALNDQIRVRSTFGTSFRTPALFELHLADQTSGISATKRV